MWDMEEQPDLILYELSALIKRYIYFSCVWEREPGGSLPEKKDKREIFEILSSSKVDPAQVNDKTCQTPQE